LPRHKRCPYKPLRPKIEATLDALHHGLRDSDLLFAIGARAFGVEDDPNLVVDEVVRIIGEERIDTFPGNPRRLRISQANLLGRPASTVAAVRPTAIPTAITLVFTAGGIESSEVFPNCM
jgi:hypothetical protein